MGKILQALASDNLSAEPSIYKGTSAYNKARDTYCSLGEKLLSVLNDDEKQLLEDYTSAQADESQLYSADRFVSGFKIGLLMAVETFTETDEFILTSTSLPL